MLNNNFLSICHTMNLPLNYPTIPMNNLFLQGFFMYSQYYSNNQRNSSSENDHQAIKEDPETFNDQLAREEYKTDPFRPKSVKKDSFSTNKSTGHRLNLQKRKNSKRDEFKQGKTELKGKFSSAHAVKYNFSTLLSRKKEKKQIRTRGHINSTRVHNMDCMLKKIKSKYLKYLLNCLNDLIGNSKLKKFDQISVVRNLNVYHNRDEFINLSVSEFLQNCEILTMEDSDNLFKLQNAELEKLLMTKVKFHYQFDFLCSEYFIQWMKDPIGLEKKESGMKKNKNCEKFEKYSKNLFSNTRKSYENYTRLLLITANDFVFYFQNNPMKYGKKN